MAALRAADEFMASVLACPEMKSVEYLRAIQVVGGAVLLKARKDQ